MSSNTVQPSRVKILWGDELGNKEYPPTKWVVCGLIPEGLTMLAGPSKLGKSLWAIQLCTSVADGTSFLGQYDCTQSKALYVTWEDPERRVKERCESINDCVPTNFGLVYCPEINGKELSWLNYWLDSSQDLKLIVFDTVAYLREDPSAKGDIYLKDVKFFKPFHKIANDRNVSILFITHMNQNEKLTDTFSRIQGSTGQIGTVDTVLVMEGNRNGKATLSGAGRDLPSFSITMGLDEETMRWKSLEAEAPANTCDRIIAFLKTNHSGSHKQICEALGIDRCYTQLTRLVERKKIEKWGGGYRLFC